MNNLSYVSGYVWIQSNQNLLDLSGLENLMEINGDLTIKLNGDLLNLDGLNNINPGSISNLTIENNISLSTCHIESICEYLSDPNGMVNINNNAFGCNDSTEIIDSCEYVNQVISIPIKNILIYPNPTHDDLYISCKSGLIIKKVNIYNQFGQIILTETHNPYIIDIRKLKQGLYIIELKARDFETREKLIVK